MEPLPRGANFVRAKTLWEIGLHMAGNPATPYGGNRDMVITIGSGSGAHFRPWLRLATGSAIRSLHDIKQKRYPLRVSVREDPTHSTLVLIDQAFSLHGFSLRDIESWGGHLLVCGSPFDARRMEPLRRGELDAIFDEGIKTWLAEALACELAPIELSAHEFEQLGRLGWRRVALPKARFPRLTGNIDTLDSSGWPIYASASLAEEAAYNVCGAIAARAAEIPWERGTEGSVWQMGRESDATPMDVPLHPGAERWYREHPER